MWRDVNSKRILICEIIYRILITTIQFLFLWAVTGDVVFGGWIAIVWNILNFTISYIYRYTFAKMFMVGELK